MTASDRTRFRVFPYSRENLVRALTDCFDPPQTRREEVIDKNHIEYFETYFKGLERIGEKTARTIVREERYTDHDFLDDYAAYYVRCLAKYGSRCGRLHFFAFEFGQNDLNRLTCGEADEDLEKAFSKEDNYLGFVVIRPLPRTFIGRTCLRTYPERGGRHYAATRYYPVHLAGYELKVKSLAFQEQDQAVSACATSALWSAFHATGMLFQHPIYSPVEITRHATARVPGLWRSLPNRGLNVEQMAAAITATGLEPESPKVSEQEGDLQGVTYGYLKLGIPVLLTVCLVDAHDQNDGRPYDPTDPWALHAVTVTGFSLGRADCEPVPKWGTLFKHSRIDKLYVHDDQIGPFARVKFAAPLKRKDPESNECIPVSGFSLETSWRRKGTRERSHIRFIPLGAMVPLYHKIRISYSCVWAEVIKWDIAAERLRSALPSLLPEWMVWDVYLAFGWEIEERIRGSRDLRAEDRADFLERPLPRFLWVAIGRCGKNEVVDILFDATDVETGYYCIGAIWHDAEAREALKAGIA